MFDWDGLEGLESIHGTCLDGDGSSVTSGIRSAGDHLNHAFDDMFADPKGQTNNPQVISRSAEGLPLQYEGGGTLPPAGAGPSVPAPPLPDDGRRTSVISVESSPLDEESADSGEEERAEGDGASRGGMQQ